MLSKEDNILIKNIVSRKKVWYGNTACGVEFPTNIGHSQLTVKRLQTSASGVARGFTGRASDLRIVDTRFAVRFPARSLPCKKFFGQVSHTQLQCSLI